MRRPVVASIAVVTFGGALFTLLSLTACYSNVASDSPGDPPADAGAGDTPRALGGGSRIRALTNTMLEDHPAQDASVDITGATVIVIDSFDETHNGKSIGYVYVQDVGPAPVPGYSGIVLYKPNYSPPNLLLQPGDVIDMTGTYQDYRYQGWIAGETQPELYEPTVTFRFEYTPPQPTVLPVGDIPDPYTFALFEKGYPWMSMLVEIDDVHLTESVPDGTGRQAIYFTTDTSVNAPSVSNELFDLNPADYGCVPTSTGNCEVVHCDCTKSPKAHLSKLIGVVTFFYGYHIAPRSPADLVIAQ